MSKMFNTCVLAAAGLFMIAGSAHASTSWQGGSQRIGLISSGVKASVSGRTLPENVVEQSTIWSYANTFMTDSPIGYSFSESFTGFRPGVEKADFTYTISAQQVGDAIIFRGQATADIQVASTYTESFSIGFGGAQGYNMPRLLVDTIAGATVPVKMTFNATSPAGSEANSGQPIMGYVLSPNVFTGVANGAVGVQAYPGDPDGVAIYSDLGATSFLVEEIDTELTFDKATTSIQFPSNIFGMNIGFDTKDGDNPTDYNGVYSFGWEVVIGTVPAPSAAALLGMGGLIAARRRRAC